MNGKKIYLLMLFALSTAVVFFNGCSDDDDDAADYTFAADDADLQSKVEETLINIAAGEIVEFGAGTFNFTGTLSLDDVANVTIRGAGRDATTLSFAGQTVGAEGIKVTADNFTIEDLTIEDTEGDAIKVKDSDNVTFNNVGVVWTGAASEENGAYGLYPVQCTDVLIDNCYVKGASDAGIYVGQSRRAIVRNSLVEFNVAGIEIENTVGADVYNNTARNNTGGILVFDLPNLDLVNGGFTRVYDNNLEDNSYRNFAPAGNSVGNVPPGTGIMIMGTDNVEVFDNIITECNVMGVGIVSYLVLENFGSPAPEDDLYNPYPSSIYIHDNTFARSNTYPAELNAIGTILAADFPDGDMPDILYDGIEDPELGGESFICIKDNGATFVNVHAESFGANPFFPNKTFDLEPHNCTIVALPAIELE